MLLVIALIVPVWIGMLAQFWKGHTGALWGVLTLVVELGAHALVFFSVGPSMIDNTPKGQETWVLMSATGTFLLMGLIVATLPNRKPKNSDSLAS